MGSPTTKKHKCKSCPHWKWILDTEEYTCVYGIDWKIMPDGNCRCRFGKEWFNKNVLNKL